MNGIYVRGKKLLVWSNELEYRKKCMKNVGVFTCHVFGIEFGLLNSHGIYLMCFWVFFQRHYIIHLNCNISFDSIVFISKFTYLHCNMWLHNETLLILCPKLFLLFHELVIIFTFSEPLED